MKKLDIQPLSQRDTRWKNQRLGMVNGVTIGSDGCVDTCQSMLLTYHGFPILPNQLDNLLTDKGLYYDAEGNGPVNDDLWVPANISKIWDKMKYVKTIYCETVSAPINEIKDAIDRGQPPTMWLINGKVKHNVLAVGYDGNKILVNDPWMGDQVFIEDRWGESSYVILSVDFYEGPMAQNNISVPQSDFEGMVFKSTQHDKTAKNWGFDDPRNTTSEQIDATIQKSISAYKGQASSANEAKEQAEGKLAVAIQEVKNREEQVVRLNEQLTDNEKVYLAEIDALKNKPSENESLVTTLKTQVEQYKSKYDAEAKAKGKALNDLAEAQSQLEVCKKGIKTKSLWQAIMDFLKKTTVLQTK